MIRLWMRFVLYLILSYLITSPGQLTTLPNPYYKIRVIDEETGRGIPMVELRTTNRISYYTDSNGITAFYEPGLMNQMVYFYLYGPGYEYPQDILGSRGIALPVSAGDSALIKMKRLNIAQRLYRITGAGIYRDSYLLGLPVPTRYPLINGKVMGQDSNLSLIYKNKIFWIWGDTFKPSYSWGNFSVSAATSELPSRGGLNPEVGVDLNYFVDSTGFSKKMIEIPGPGFVWFDWLMTVKDENNQEKLVAKYARVKQNFENYERGIAVYDDKKEMFVKYRKLEEWLGDYCVTHHPIKVKVKNNIYYYLTSEFSFSRVKPELLSVSDPAAYEYFSCLATGTEYQKTESRLDRDRGGKLIWDWKFNTDPVDFKRQQELVDSNKIKPEEKWIHLQDFPTGNLVSLRRGSIHWNDYRQRWIMIFEGEMGDIWYAEGDTPTGPWVFARKVAEHDHQLYNPSHLYNPSSLYNPSHHPFFDKHGGKTIFFEGTYTNIYTGHQSIVPRYEYNQLMYQLALDDPRLFLPAPVYSLNQQSNGNIYHLRETVDSSGMWNNVQEVAFFAFPPNRAIKTLVPIFQDSDEHGAILRIEGSGKPLFYGLPADAKVDKKFIGSWDGKITDDFIFIKEFKMHIDYDGEKYTGKFEDAGLSVLKLSVDNDTLMLNVQYVDRKYELIGTVEAGMLSGSWHGAAPPMAGTWEAKVTDHLQHPLHSPLLAPLYCYVNPKTGKRFYSTNIESKEKGFHREKKPLCRVWKNPSGLLILDFEAKQVDDEYR
jgi:hypothetical protein